MIMVSLNCVKLYSLSFDVFLDIIFTGLVVTRYVHRLKQVYRTLPSQWMPLVQCEFVELAIVRRKGKRRKLTKMKSITSESMATGRIAEILDKMEVLKVDEIFSLESNVILVEGAAGLGKTRLTHHYSQQWADGQLLGFEIVALVDLQNLKASDLPLPLPKIFKCACHGHVSDEVAREVAELVANSDLKCLIIFDGWNEAPIEIRKESFVTHILESVSSSTTLLITSRPNESVLLHNLATSSRLEILGFTEENVSKYFKKALTAEICEAEVDDELERLRNHTRSHPAIKRCCYNPLNAAILASLYLQSRESLPRTCHGMFYELVLWCIKREMGSRKVNIQGAHSFEDLPQQLKHQLHSLCTVAYEGVIQNQHTFCENEVTSIVSANAATSACCCLLCSTTAVQESVDCLGILHKSTGISKSGHKVVTYSFVHTSVQELLAAYFISKMKKKNQTAAFRELSVNSSPWFSAVLHFYAGFTKLGNVGVQEIIENELYAPDDRSKHKLLTFLGCFFEAQIQDPSFYRKVISSLNSELYLAAITLNPTHCMAIGYFLASALRTTSECIKVVLWRCGITEHTLGLLLHDLHTVSIESGGIQLKIGGNDIEDAGLAHIVGVLKMYQHNHMLRVLNIDMCGVTVVGAEVLADVLTTNKSLTDLSICRNNIEDDGMGFFANALTRNSTLTCLSIGGWNVTDAGVRTLCTSIKANESLESLTIEWPSTQTDESLEELKEDTEHNTKIQVTFYSELLPYETPPHELVSGYVHFTETKTDGASLTGNNDEDSFVLCDLPDTLPTIMHERHSREQLATIVETVETGEELSLREISIDRSVLVKT